MKKNRRNYYRILHVQPEAPPEIIKASYRTLMSTLKMHPDLGGDHEMASLINEAYAVLSDRTRRTAYDRQVGTSLIRGRNGGAAARGAQFGQAEPPRRAEPQASAARNAEAPAQGPCCPWCQDEVPTAIKADTRCRRCRSPLAPPPGPGAQGKELFGRRAATRNARPQLAIMNTLGQGAGLSVRLRDISLTGLSLMATTAVAPGTPIRIQAPDFEAIAVVVSTRRAQESHIIHARLVTMAFTRRDGVFVSEKA